MQRSPTISKKPETADRLARHRHCDPAAAAGTDYGVDDKSYHDTFFVFRAPWLDGYSNGGQPDPTDEEEAEVKTQGCDEVWEIPGLVTPANTGT
jgi:hypothetical protein